MTNTTAHTPGPWLVYKDAARFPGIEAGLNGRNFSVVVYGTDNELEGVKGRTHAEAIANARLIAAAPALMAALEQMIPLAEMINLNLGDDRYAARIAAARAAIAAAKGNKS